MCVIIFAYMMIMSIILSIENNIFIALCTVISIYICVWMHIFVYTYRVIIYMYTYIYIYLDYVCI